MGKELKYMANKHKLYSIALVSTAMVSILASIASAAPFAYVTNAGSNSVSRIDTSTNTVVGSQIIVGNSPFGIANTPNGAYAYVTNFIDGTASVIDTSTNTIFGSPITVGSHPVYIAITPNGAHAYVTNFGSNTVSVIDTSTNTIFGSPITVGNNPFGIAINPKTTPTLTWNPNPTTITYGTALVAGQLNAQSSAAGTFAYTEGSTPVNI